MQLSSSNLVGRPSPWQRQRRQRQCQRLRRAAARAAPLQNGAGAQWGGGGPAATPPAPIAAVAAAAAGAAVTAYAAATTAKTTTAPDTAAAAAAAAAATATAAASAAGSTAADVMAAFRYTTTLSDGTRVAVEPLREEQIEQCAELLAEAFASTSARIAPYERFLRRRIELYLQEHVQLPPKALVLACVVEAGAGSKTINDSSSSINDSSKSINDSSSSTTTTSSNGTSSNKSNQPQQPQLIGAAEVSFDRSTRSTYLTLNAPPRCAYACNTAVAPAWRRRGAARALMAAIEAVAAAAGERECYLHLRMRDDAGPGQLYRSLGYEEAAADSPLLALIGYEQRWLMRKALGNGSGGSSGGEGGPARDT